MPDEATPETPDTSAEEQTAAPEGTPAPEPTEGSTAQTQDDTDWQQRATDAQAWGTRVSQENADLRQYRDTLAAAQQGDPEAQRQIAAWLEWEIEGGDEEEEEIPEFLDPRVDQLLQAEAERQREAQLDGLEDYVDGEIDALAKAASYDLSDPERKLVFSALTPKADQSGPDVEAAFKLVTGLRDAHVKDYVAGKRRPPQAPSGSSPSHQPDLDDDEQRRAFIASRLG